jgi:PKD repeat protein
MDSMTKTVLCLAFAGTVAIGALSAPGSADAQRRIDRVDQANRGERPRPNAVPGDKTRGEDWQIEQRERWWIESRGLERQGNAAQLRRSAIRSMRAQAALRAKADKAAGAVWRELGPSSMQMGSWAIGRVAGRINAITPEPGNDNTVYIGAANGGVWKTTNAGVSWTPLFSDVGSQSVGAIHVESATPQNVWVGTGDRRTGSCSGYLSEGVFFSSNGGASWSPRNTGMNLSTINALLTLPENADVVLAAGFGDRCNQGGDGNGGLYRSIDKGANWTQVVDRAIEDLVAIPGTSTVYASAPGSGIYRSTDGGANWTALGPSNTSSRMRLAVAPSDPSVMYALTSSTLYRSDDAGTSWSTVNTAACDGQCTYNLTLAVHPTSPMTVMVGAIRPRRSLDGGLSFTVLTNAWGSAQQVHQDTHVVRYSSLDPKRIWIGSDGGIWRSDNDAISWANMNSNLNITQYYDIGVHPDDRNMVFGGAQDNSSSRRTTSNVWDLTFVNGDGFMNAIDETNPAIVFQNGYPSGTTGLPSIYRSTRTGAPGSFSYMGTSGLTGTFPWVTPADVAGGYHFVGSQSVFRAVAGGASMTWTPVSPTVSGSINVITARKIGGNVHVYAGTTGGKVLYSGNAAMAGLTDVTGNLPGSRVTDVAIDPLMGNRAYVTLSRYTGAKLYRTTTGGGNWTPIGAGLPDIPASSVAIDPLNVQRLFVGTDIGVFESLDGGANFSPMTTGMPAGLVVTDLEVDDQPHILTAGTYGRGAWQIDLDTENAPPVAAFGTAVSNLTVDFTDTSVDTDGSIVAHSWNFGDGISATTANPSHTYAAAGTYTVTLTVTDNTGATASASKSVIVSTGNTLVNGVQVGGIRLAPGASRTWTLAVPAGAANLRFTTSGASGSGDADLYVKFGAAPTTSAGGYDCRSAGKGPLETCRFPTPQAGTYHVMIVANSALNNVELLGSYATSASNTPPVPDFTVASTDRTASFTDTSVDSDGRIEERLWNFGDGVTSDLTHPIHTYAAAGTYTVTLTVTDNGDVARSVSKSVTVTQTPIIALPECTATDVRELGRNCKRSNLSIATGELGQFTLNLPSGVGQLKITVIGSRATGDQGNIDLYYRAGGAATTGNYTLRSTNRRSAETLIVTSPPAGSIGITLHGASGASGVTVSTEY